MNEIPSEMGRQCEGMADRELVRAVTVDREKFAAGFHSVALGELQRREVSLERFVDFAWVGHPTGRRRRCSVAEALEVVDEEMPLWRLFLFGNCLDDALVMQRERSQWTIHHYVAEEYRHSFFLFERNSLRSVLDCFLRLEPWAGLVEQTHNLDDWELFEHSSSREQIDQLATELGEGGIPHTIKPPSISRDQDEAFSLLVPAELLDAADEIVNDFEGELDRLYTQATELAAGADPRRELEVYGQLVEAAPTNPAVFYNRGSLLLELGRYQEAADSLVEAVSLGMEVAQTPLQPGLNQGGGGLLGVVVTLFRKSFADGGRERSPSYPDFIEDAEMLLGTVLEHLPNNTKVIHCLASICRLRHDAAGAASHYRRILDIEPDDRIARFYLGYLQAAHDGDRPDPGAGMSDVGSTDGPSRTFRG